MKEITNRCRRADCASCPGTLGPEHRSPCRCRHHKTGVSLVPRPKGIGIRRFLAGISDRRRDRARARLAAKAPPTKVKPKPVVNVEEARKIINTTVVTEPGRRSR